MQNITSASNQVSLNTTAPVTNGSWSKMTASGNSLIAKAANAALAVLKTLASFAYNVVAWPFNKIFSLFSSTPANNVNVVVDQNNVVVSIYDPAQAADQIEAEKPISEAEFVQIEEELPEPLVAPSKNRPWLKPAAVAAVALGVIGADLYTSGAIRSNVEYAWNATRGFADKLIG